MIPNIFIITYLSVFICLTTTRNSYKQITLFLTNTPIDSFCAIQSDDLKVAIGNRVGHKFGMRIYTLSEVDRTMKLHQILESFQAQQIYVRFSDKGDSLIIVCNRKTIRHYRVTEKNNIQQFQLIQIYELPMQANKIRICQRQQIILVTVNNTLIIYSSDDYGKIVKRSQSSHRTQIIAMSISPDGQWVAVSTIANLHLLKLDGDLQTSLICSEDIKDDFDVQFIIIIEDGKKIFLIDEGAQKQGGSIRIFETDFSQKKLYQRQHFENFTDFTRSLSVSDNGHILAFFSQHNNRIWIYVKSETNNSKSKSSYEMLQSFNANQSVLNHLWLTSYGQYMIMSDERGSISVYKDTQLQDGSAMITIIVIIIVACIIGAVIYYYKKKETGYSFEQSHYFQMKDTKK